MCQACTPPVGASQTDAFAEKIVTMYNNAATTLMISIGHRTGLFDVMSDMPPGTSDEIAEQGGLNERYVREWLGAMTVAKIVEYDPATGHYHLPEAHAALLTRNSAPDNLAVTATWLPVLSSVEDQITGCFLTGGGVPYEDYHRFHEVMAEESKQTVVIPLIEHILPLAPEIISKLEAGANVLDFGCGQGRALIALAERFPHSTFHGHDLCDEAIEKGRAEAAHLPNLTLSRMDVAEFTETENYDVIFTFDSVHDQADPAKVLSNIHRALKSDGIYLMQDIAGSSDVEKNKAHPLGPFIYTISCLHCMSVSLAQGGAGLGAMWGEELAESMARDAGFTGFEKKTLEHDIINNFYILRK